MKKERIIKIGRLVYIKAFTNGGYIDKSRYQSFAGKDGKEYDCTKLFWRIYKIDNI
jgi:hypothetical protein